MDELLPQVRQFLNITWDDDDLDAMLNVYIKSSKDRLNYIAGMAEGESLDFSSGLANDLLLNRVLYMNSHQLSDFETNYLSELNSLRIMNHYVSIE